MYGRGASQVRGIRCWAVGTRQAGEHNASGVSSNPEKALVVEGGACTLSARPHLPVKVQYRLRQLDFSAPVAMPAPPHTKAGW